MNTRGKSRKLLRVGIFAIIIVLLFSLTAFAEAKSYIVTGTIYEGNESTAYNSTSTCLREIFSYGRAGMGSLSVLGNINNQTSYRGCLAYSATGTLIIKYDYDGSFREGEKEDWNIISDSSKIANEVSLTKKIGDGVFVVQKSYDGHNWVNATDPICDFFSAKKIDRENLYSITEEDLKTGTYFRVTIAYKIGAYKIGKKTGEEPLVVQWSPIRTDIYEYKYCMEVYEFFACYGNNPITFSDVITGDQILSGSTVRCGFIVDKNGSTDTVSVKKKGENAVTVETLTTIHEAGTYIIETTDLLGKKYTATITVSEGMKISALTPMVFENERKDEYTEENLVSTASFGASSHTSLMVGHNSTESITKSTRNGFTAYGITGSEAYLYLRLQNQNVIEQNGWEVLDDSWGKKSNQTICGVQTGQVDSGAIVIQTSTDGTEWVNVDQDRYANGLYTTDYEANYGLKGDVLVYMPDGNALLNGVYIRVIYAYEIKQASSKNDLRVLEKYEFYLCSNELDAVAFHNLSVESQMSAISEEYDNVTADIRRHSETMLSGAYTVSGFSIDTVLNPTVTYTVKKNGCTIAIPASHQFKDTGKYEITLTSGVNSTKTVTIYVDRMTNDQSLQYYFGDAFISGKRIYSDGEYATYEGGLTSYQVCAVDDYHLPVSGQIQNITTGDIITIDDTRTSKTGVLSTPGEYIAVLSTNPDFDSNTASGDCKTFTFHFEIIAEGTAPGPIVNRQSLQKYAGLSVSDSYPIYYALTYPSASTGYITLAFCTKEEALKFAYNYEKGMVEQQSDGTYRYTGSFIVAQKEKYNSAWDLTDAVNYFAEQAVQVGYFDSSNEFTVLSLTDSIIDSTINLRTLELARSVTIFAPDQKAELTALDALPIISNKPYSYLTPGLTGNIESGFYDFEFVQDKYNCDSYTVVITDCNGKNYEIEYNKSVDTQLMQQGCPTGIITITESTIYGDTAIYQAVYIADGDNTASLTLTYHLNNQEKTIGFTQGDDGTSVEVEAFSISDFSDELDPFSLVIVSDGKNEYFYVADQAATGIWTDPGNYDVKVVNRLGYYYSIGITVVKSDYATIRFSGDGTESTQDILTMYGAQNVALPVIERYGFNLVGFEDSQGIIYSDTIGMISFRGSVVLNAVWQAKQYTVTLQNPDGVTIDTLLMDFGKEYELPTPELDEGYAFSCWTLNGVALESNMITLNTEGDITLVASADQSRSSKNEFDSTKTSGNSNHAEIIIIAAIVPCVAFATAVITSRSRRFKCSKKQILSSDNEDRSGGIDDEQ